MAFTFFSLENILVLFVAVLFTYFGHFYWSFHWGIIGGIVAVVVVIDLLLVCWREGKCSFEQETSLEKIQNVVRKEKRLFVWKKNKLFRKLLCQFEKNCQEIHGSLALLDLPETSVVKNMGDVLRQLQGEFVDALYEFYIVGKNCPDVKTETCGDLKYVEKKISSIKERLENLQKSVELAHVNTLKIRQLGEAMQGMTDTLSQSKDS